MEIWKCEECKGEFMDIWIPHNKLCSDCDPERKDETIELCWDGFSEEPKESA